MDIKVKTCYDCPFMNLDYDDWAPGDDTYVTCNAAESIGIEDIHIKSFKMHHSNEEELNFRPNWCPLEKQNINVSIF
jgi:hypothetical protein